MTAIIASRLSTSASAPTTSCSRLFSRHLHNVEMPDTTPHTLSSLIICNFAFDDEIGVFTNRRDVAVSYRAMCLKALPGSVQGLMLPTLYLTQFVALDAGAESKACSEEPSGDCRSRSGERCEEHQLPGGFCGHLLRSHIPAPQALLLGPQAALLRYR